MSVLPPTQRAVVIKNPGKNWTAEVVPSHPVPRPGPGQALVRLTHTGVCHSDLSCINGGFGLKLACDVPGHEGVGKIVAYYEGLDSSTLPALGTRVGIPLLQRPCGTCASCGLPDGEVHCPNTKLLGSLCDGTFQQYITVYVDYMVLLPNVPGIDDATLAPTLCGGVTAYKALKKSGAKRGDWVAVAGAGGGLGNFAVQYAVSMGFQVIGIDTGEDKRQATLRLGAAASIDFRTTNDVPAEVMKITGGAGVQSAIVLAPSEVTYNQALQYVALQGCLMCVGLPDGDAHLHVPPSLVCRKDITIKGSFVGTRDDIAEALKYVVRGEVKPDIVIYPMDDVEVIFHKMEGGQIQGRAVLDLS
ncbi:alcohol dehydrogenase 2 [Ilyonectria robusta]